MKQVSRNLIVFLSLMLGINVLYAQATDPIALLQNITSTVIQELNAHQVEVDKNPKQIYKIVNTIILPHADFDEMAQWVAGREAWQKASPTLKEQFIVEFKQLVVNTYGNALAAYHDQKIEFLPIRGNFDAKSRVVVSSVIKEANKSPLRVDYKLIRKTQGWKVYDIVIEGVSLIKGYQAQFMDDIRAKGLAPTIQKITQKNSAS